MNNPLVSVVIPTYNGSQLVKAVNSVLLQSHENLEVIVVDDCSEKPARKRLEGIEDDRLEIIRHKENKNASAARNTGISRSNGDYIALLDDDDVWNEEKLEKQLDLLNSKGEEFKACYTGAKVKYDYGSGELIPRREGDITQSILLTNSSGSYGSTLLVEKSIVEKTDGFDEDFDRHQDLEFVIRLLDETKICCVSEPLIKRDMTNYLQDTRVLVDNKERFLAKFDGKIRNQGIFMSRKIYSVHYLSIAKTAMRNKDYEAGIENYFKSIIQYPFHKPKELARPPYYFSRQITIGLNNE